MRFGKISNGISPGHQSQIPLVMSITHIKKKCTFPANKYKYANKLLRPTFLEDMLTRSNLKIYIIYLTVEAYHCVADFNSMKMLARGMPLFYRAILGKPLIIITQAFRHFYATSQNKKPLAPSSL